MLRRLLLILCFVGLGCLAANADIPFSFAGGAATGTIAPGQPFSYDHDGGTLEGDWGSPGVGAGTLVWSGPTIYDFEITFALQPGTSIDPAQILVGNGAGCVGSTGGGTTFCASPFTPPWKADLVAPNSIAFYAPPGEPMANGDSYFVNIFFSGPDPNGASFTGTWTTPEPSSLLLLSSGVVGLA